MSLPFVHQPLASPHHIRLLEIQPGNSSDAICCTLTEWSRHEAPPYEALSYAWGVQQGDTKKRPEIQLDGKPFSISSSLQGALRHLRSASHSRIMWIDAISIDQGNAEERSAQVCIMRDIYRGAERVVVWLGEETESSPRALRLLKELAVLQEQNEDRRLTQAEQSTHVVAGYPVLYYDFFGPDLYKIFRDERQSDWEALDELLQRPWFSRTWIVQEVWNARACNMQCGTSTMEWDEFALAMNFHEAWDDMGHWVQRTKRWAVWPQLQRRYGLAIHLARKRLYGAAESKVSDLLWNTWDREATDPRDKVFAVLGILEESSAAEQTDTSLIIVDYNKSLSRVYKEAAAYIIGHDKKLDLLLAAHGVGAGQDASLPSWVPDWRRAANDRRPTLFINGSDERMRVYHSGSTSQVVLQGHGYSASADTDVQVAFSDDLDRLTVSAIVLDTVQIVGPSHDGQASVSDMIEGVRATIGRWAPDPKRHSQLPESSQLGDDEIRYILRSGMSLYTVVPYHWGQNEKAEKEERVIKNVMKYRCLFITQQGHLCIGPDQVKEGDAVVIMAGCSFPMVLRRNAEDNYHVVGEAYVRNNMAGEALLEDGEKRPFSDLHLV